MTFKSTILALGVAALLSSPLAAAPKPGDSLVYGILHESYGDVGEHKVTFAQDGADLVVAVDNWITVKVLFITGYRFTAQREERWRDGRLVAYRSDTDDDGETVAVLARANGDKLEIDGKKGRLDAPLGTFPTHPWNRAIVGQSQLMHTKSGKLLDVTITEAGRETIQAAEQAVETTKYLVTGDQERELWFDDADNWVQMRFIKDGSAVTFTLR